MQIVEYNLNQSLFREETIYDVFDTFRESFKEFDELLSESKLLKSKNSIENLKKLGFDTDKLTKEIQEEMSDFKILINKGKVSNLGEVVNLIKVMVSKSFGNKVKEVFGNLRLYINNGDMHKDIVKSIAVFIPVVILNTMAMTILSIVAGPAVAMGLTAVLVAPITEELGKFISVKYEFGDMYNIVFNVFEFSQYMMNGFNFFKTSRVKDMGKKMGKFAIMRMSAVTMHTINTYIIKFAPKLAKTEKGQEQARILATIVTGFIHGIHNYVGGKKNDKIIEWLMK